MGVVFCSQLAIASQAIDSAPVVKALTEDPLVRQYQQSFDDSLVDLDLIHSLLRYVFQSGQGREGSVLIFLPGWDEIMKLGRLLRFSEFGAIDKFKIVQLHSAVPRKEQAEAFVAPKPGQVKIILSTNVAETSITIDDVTTVIDCGKVKEISYDPHVKLSYLKTTYISRASSRQRKGRSGRTKAGVCFHLYSRTRHQSLAEFQDSELLRMPLEELVLQTKVLGLAPGQGNAANFLEKAMDPPHALSIENALSNLRSVHCLDDKENVTPIGAAVSKLPIEPMGAFTILLGSLLGIGSDVVKTIAAMSREPFVPPSDDQRRSAFDKVRVKFAQSIPSDQISLFKALDSYLSKVKTSNYSTMEDFCEKHFLSRTALTYLADVSRQMGEELSNIRVTLNQPKVARHNGDLYLLTALVGIGLYPNIALRRKSSTVYATEKGPKAKIHASSVNFHSGQYKKACKGDAEILSFGTLVSSRSTQPGAASLLMIGTTPISPLALILGCSSLSLETNEISKGNEDEESAIFFSVDDWIRFKIDPKMYLVLLAARSALVEALVLYIQDPTKALPPKLDEAVEAIAFALASEQRAICSQVGN